MRQPTFDGGFGQRVCVILTWPYLFDSGGDKIPGQDLGHCAKSVKRNLSKIMPNAGGGGGGNIVF